MYKIFNPIGINWRALQFALSPKELPLEPCCQSTPMILPALLPDETLGSLLSRMCRLNGISDFRDLAAIYFGQPVYASFIDGKICLPEFTSRTARAYGDSAHLLERTTWLNAQARLGELDPPHLSAIEQGSYLPTLGELTFSDRTSLAYCPSCLNFDIKRFGMTYWHCVHQLILVRCCPWHGCPVVRVKIERKDLHKRFPLPGDPMFQMAGSNFDGTKLADPWQALAIMIWDVMKMPSCTWSPEIIDQTISEELRTRNLAMPSGSLRMTEIAQCLATHFSYEWTEGNSDSSLVCRMIYSLVQHKRGVKLGRMALVQWLFGNWQSFMESCRWTAALGAAPRKLGADAASNPSEHKIREHYRQNGMAFMQENPGSSRLEFTKAEYRSFRWLLHNDRHWLDKHFPITARSPIQLSLL